MTSRQAIIRFVLCVAGSMVWLTSCRPVDPQVPWDREPMVRELVADLREFEGFTSGLAVHEVLAWRVDAHNGDRVEISLVWGRTTDDLATARWVLIQGFRHPGGDNTWHRSLSNRYLISPLTHPRPGEDRDGTWHAFQIYEHAPTAREICDFAAVDIIASAERGAYRRVSEGVQRQAWQRVAGAEPECGFAR
jgi:hypothetical protein